MKYQSELIKEIVDSRGHKKSSLHYESECVETWIEENKGAYPKLCDYESEWLIYINENPIGNFPYENVTTNRTATVNNVVPFAYQSAILTGNTLVNIFDATLPTQIKNTHDITLSYRVNANETYTFIVEAESTSEQYQAGFITLDGRANGWKGFINNGFSKFTVTTSEATNKVRFSAYGASNTLQIKKCMIIKGDYTNQDIPFFTGMQSVKMPVLTTSNEDGTKTNILSTPSDLELRGIGVVKDTLNCLTGEVVERIGEIELVNREWIKTEAFNVLIYGTTIDNLFFDKDGNSMCDKLSRIPYDNRFNIEVGQYYTNAEYIYIGHNDMSVSEFKTYIDRLSPKLQYQLKTPTIKTVDLTVTDQSGNTLSTIKPIEGTMNIEVSGSPIAPTAVLDVPVEATTQNLASFIDLEMEEKQ